MSYCKLFGVFNEPVQLVDQPLGGGKDFVGFLDQTLVGLKCPEIVFP